MLGMGNVARKRCWPLPCFLLVLQKEPTEPRLHHQLRRDKRCLGTLPGSDGGAWDFHYVDQFWCHRIIGFVVIQLKKYVSRRSIWTAKSYLLVLNRIFMVRAVVSPPSSRLSSELVDSGEGVLFVIFVLGSCIRTFSIQPFIMTSNQLHDHE